MITPQPVTDVRIAFPGDVQELMPDLKEIPSGYWSSDGSWSDKLFTTLFFRGVKQIALRPREGVDPELAWRHITAIMRSFAPKHEDKEAVCRYLMDQWFLDATWE